ncbi:MAG: helix-turn-helix transcriptional regulator [Clostridiales bacterium]|nr:helix-turn-helix transcriptional regulator [Clostridiales bacterium]
MLILQILRCRQGLTQQELACRVGVGQAAISMWEGGTNRPRADRLPVLAEALSCTIDDLFTEVNEEEAVRWALSGSACRPLKHEEKQAEQS